MVLGRVREWDEERGWGVLDSPETPGGCWTHFSAIEPRFVRHLGDVAESDYLSLAAGDRVELEWETPGQDGFDYRAVTVRRRS